MTPAAHLHKLTTMEFANSVNDLLGSAAPELIEGRLDVEGIVYVHHHLAQIGATLLLDMMVRDHDTGVLALRPEPAELYFAPRLA